MDHRQEIISLCSRICEACGSVSSLTGGAGPELEELYSGLRLDELEHAQLLILQLTELITADSPEPAGEALEDSGEEDSSASAAGERDQKQEAGDTAGSAPEEKPAPDPEAAPATEQAAGPEEQKEDAARDGDAGEKTGSEPEAGASKEKAGGEEAGAAEAEETQESAPADAPDPEEKPEQTEEEEEEE